MRISIFLILIPLFIFSCQNTETEIKENKVDDIDAEIDKVLAMTPKKKRKPLSEENKQKKRELLAKSRLVRTVNAQNKVEVEKKYKEKLRTNVIEMVMCLLNIFQLLR